MSMIVVKDACAGIGFNGDTHHIIHQGHYVGTYPSYFHAELAKDYIEHIGYDPFADDKLISLEEVELTLREYHSL